MVYNYILVMTNTGMRTIEAYNLRWRDIDQRTDRQNRPFVCINVRGKSKFRELIAPPSVGEYLGRIRAISKATKPDDFVFTNYDGTRNSNYYKKPIRALLEAANLLTGSAGTDRSAYSFRHTYATFRLMEGVDVYFLAKQMGTSVKMIEDYYGHVTPSTSTDQILQGMPGWESVASPGHRAAAESDEGASPTRRSRSKAGGPRRRKSPRNRPKAGETPLTPERLRPSLVLLISAPGVVRNASVSVPAPRSQGWHHPAFTNSTSRPACDLFKSATGAPVARASPPPYPESIDERTPFVGSDSGRGDLWVRGLWFGSKETCDQHRPRLGCLSNTHMTADVRTAQTWLEGFPATMPHHRERSPRADRRVFPRLE
jgi:hypothetical protein